MNRKEFGQLVKALRKEHRDAEGGFWTQETLAHRANLSPRTIGRIENGTLRKFDKEVLLKLADALLLTSSERQEFFRASAGIDNKLMVRRSNKPEIVFTQLMKRVGGVALPAFVIDSYCDLIAANAAATALLDINAAGLGLPEMQKRPFGLNMLQFVFSNEAVSFYRERMNEYWPNYAYQNMMVFRTLSFKYRSSNYFQGLLEELLQFPYFRRYWQEVYCQERDHILDNEHIHFNHRLWGPMNFFSTSLTALSSAGELYFWTYVPATQRTTEIFVRIMEQNGSGLFPTSHWPNKMDPIREYKGYL